MDRQGLGRPQPQRKELQGPRPTPLRVRKVPSKFKKPPPGPSAPPHPPAEEDCHRAGPVIIYAVSPKVIQVTTDEFMSVVQRLTGPSPGPSPRTPAVRSGSGEGIADLGVPPEVEIEVETLLDRKDVNHHSILSPLPSWLPPISPNFFPLPSSLPPFSPNFFSNPSISPNFSVPSPDREISALLSDLSPTMYGLLPPSPLILSPGITMDRLFDFDSLIN